jgi:hypothetical protein
VTANQTGGPDPSPGPAPVDPDGESAPRGGAIEVDETEPSTETEPSPTRKPDAPRARAATDDPVPTDPPDEAIDPTDEDEALVKDEPDAGDDPQVEAGLVPAGEFGGADDTDVVDAAAEPLGAEPVPAESSGAVPLAAEPSTAEPLTAEPLTAPTEPPAGESQLEPGHGGAHLAAATDGPSGADEPLLADATGYQDRWNQIQTGFVDEPRRAVQSADELLAEVMDDLARTFASELEALEARWGGGDKASDKASTDDLRVAFQRYRSFFNRLLSA